MRWLAPPSSRHHAPRGDAFWTLRVPHRAAAVCLLASILIAAAPQGNGDEGKNLPASEVRFSAATLALRTALAEVEKVGNRVELRNRQSYDATNPPLTDLPTTPLAFWPAIDLLAARARLRATLRPGADGQPATLELTKLRLDESHSPRPTSYDGPFKLTLANATKGDGKLVCRFVLQWEPRRQAIWLRPGPVGVRAADGTERQEPAANPTAIRLMGLEEGSWTATPPAPPGDKADVFGEATILVSPHPLRLELPSLEPGTETTVEGVTLKLLAATPDAERRRWTVRLALTYPPGAFDLESHQGWALGDLPAELRGAGPNAAAYISPRPSDLSIEEGRSFKLSHIFADVPPAVPARLRLTVPSPPVAHRLKFSFKNIAPS